MDCEPALFPPRYVFISFVLYSAEIHPEKLTQRLDIQPTSVTLKGSRPGIKSHVWNLGSGLPNDADEEEHISLLRSILEPKLERIDSLPEEVERQMRCAIYQESEVGTGFGFDVEAFQFLARLKIKLIVEFYTFAPYSVRKLRKTAEPAE
ncbi:MAG: DUF4279 domain-containing protein [Candidatus Hydrogenedentes bacterium]|nr:DUF4279 domain-containing protein [Candidatus Hydrogenedentota bacterium]